MTTPLRALVLSCDRWHLDFIGCYGNDWIETPHLQRLAAEGVVFDRHFTACVDPEFASRAWWTGRTHLPHPVEENPADWEVRRLHEAGVHTVLFVEGAGTDDPLPAPPFAEVIHVTGRDDLDARETETPFARLVLRVEQWLTEHAADERPVLLWLQSRGVPIPWLPPQGFADLYLEDFGLEVGEAVADEADDDDVGPATGTADVADDEAVEFAEEQDLSPEQSRVPEDTRFALAMYAAYATLLDRWFGRLRGSLARSAGWSEALLVVTAAAGQPFFSSSSSSSSDGAADLADLEQSLPLRGELIQTPLIVRLPGVVAGDPDHAGTRRPALVQTIDLLPTLGEWFGVPFGPECEGRSWLPVVRQLVESIHDELLIGDGGASLALETLDLLYVETEPVEPGEEPEVRLFDQPSDRWDMCDLAAQHLQIVEELAGRLKSRRERTQP